jgi:hypothetical protein
MTEHAARRDARRRALRLAVGTLALSILAVAGAPVATANAQTTPAPTVSGSAAASGSGAAATPPLPLTVRALPIFGTEASLGFGWEEISVSLENTASAAQKGTLVLKSEIPYAEKQNFVARAPFNVPAGRSAIVRLPTKGINNQLPNVTLSVQDEKGKELQAITVTVNMGQSPTLIDVDNPARMGMVLRGWPASVAYTLTPSYAYSYAPPTIMTLSVGAPQYDRATGDPILPTRAASYSGVSVVFIHSDQLVRLEPEQKDALLAWVAGGGTLAISIARPEDLRSPEIESLAGSGITPSEAPPTLLTLPTVPRPTTPPPAPIPTYYDDDELDWDPGTKAPSDFQRLGGAPAAHDPSLFIPARTSAAGGGPPGTGPADAVREKLRGFTGGRLAPSNWGASARYGVGDVELLAFDPSISPGLDDPWVQWRMVDLVNRSWDRRATQIFPPGADDRRTYSYWGGPTGSDEIRKALDPNESFRPALGFAAILLVLYSILVGPVNFLRASKAGKPLRPLFYAPIFSAVAFGAIVVTGLVVKGFRGRARHLALVETSASNTHGSICRFRGFFTSETRSLSIAATDRSSVIAVQSSDSIMDDKANLKVDRNGLSLENLTSLPWQTLVIRENGATELKGSIEMKSAGAGSTIDVTNHLGSTLNDVLVYVPGDGIRYFAALKDGETVTASAGTFLLGAASRRIVSAGSLTVHPFDESLVTAALPRKDGQRVEKNWSPLSATAGDAVDWWPDDVPVVLGEVEGGEKLKNDSGLSIESDRLLLRVLGTPGTMTATPPPPPTGGAKP